MSEIPGSEAEFKVELVLLAMGFVHPVHTGMLDALKSEAGLGLNPRGNVKAPTDGIGAYPGSPGSSARGTCAAASPWSSGPSARGGSARAVDEWLMGRSDLPK
jgi:glutamate synthase (NADPH) small chain